MSEIISLADVRLARETPDPEHLAKDQYGRQMRTFGVQYCVGGRTYEVHVLAYSFDDAEAHVAGLRGTAELVGELHRTVLE